VHGYNHQQGVSKMRQRQEITDEARTASPGRVNVIAQIWIAAFGLTSSFLVYCRSERVRRWAPVLALIAQPAWYISCYEAEQWGVMVLTVAYTGFHLRGLWMLWARKAVPVEEFRFNDLDGVAGREYLEKQAERGFD
jgi:hypothetical protein